MEGRETSWLEPEMPRVEPDRAALEIAHRKLRSSLPLDAMLKDPALTAVLRMLARQHMRRRDQVDVKKLQANDQD
jgi:hypothetical protein